MKIKTLLVAVLVAALLLSPIALMEELQGTQDVVLEEVAPVVEEEVKTEPEADAAQPDTEETEPVEDVAQPEEDVTEAEQEITSEPVDAVVEEAEDADLSDLPMLEAQSDTDFDLDSLDSLQGDAIQAEAGMFLAEANFDVQNNSTSFSVQGKSISASSVANQNNCWTYASLIYQKIWNTSFSSDFVGTASAGLNSLRELSDANRTVTVDHIKAYIGNAQLGATLRICGCTSGCSSWGNDSLACGHHGHSMIIVQKDANGFTTVENSRPSNNAAYAVWTRYYTWQGFVNYWGRSYPYIKYIKWPNATAYANDTSNPTITNVQVSNVSSEGYTVSCNVSDNVGVTKVLFPSWYDGQRGEDATWHEGSISGNTASCRIKVSDHNNKTGCTYTTHIYAYDAAGNKTSCGVTAFVPNPDTSNPTISNVQVNNVSSEGYTVSCNVSDNVGVTKVLFPSWYDGQKGEDATWHEGSISGNTASCRIKVSDHNNKTGCTYTTHIYAYDAAGNKTSCGVTAFVPNPKSNTKTDESTQTTTSTTKTDNDPSNSSTPSKTDTVSSPAIAISQSPSSVKARAKRNKVTVSWKKIKKNKKNKALLNQIKGIEVEYSTDPNFSTDVVSKVVSKKKTKVTLKLQTKTTYYVRVRYTDGAGGVSNWSATKKVKTKK